MTSTRDEMGITIGQDGCIYAIGGFGGPEHSYLKSGEKFDILNNKWIQLASMKTARRSMCAVTLPDGIYCAGGFDGENYLQCVEK